MAQQVLAMAPSGDKDLPAAAASQCQWDKGLRAVVAAGVAGDSPAAEMCQRKVTQILVALSTPATIPDEPCPGLHSQADCPG